MGWRWDKGSLVFVLLVLGISGSTSLPDNDEHILDRESNFVHEKRQTAPAADLDLDFEVNSDKDNYFTIKPATAGHSHSLSSDRYKSGSKSLKWEWPALTQPRGATLIFAFGTSPRDGRELSRGGIKFWMYHARKAPASKMEIVFIGTDSARRPTRSTPTKVNLGFKGWRAVWIRYSEYPKGQFNLVKLSSIEFSITSSETDTLYIDLFQTVKSLAKQTRDLVVKNIGNPSPSTPLFYTEKYFWQQSLRWHKTNTVTPPKVILNRTEKIADITKIENRLENWYASTSQALYSLRNMSGSGGYDFEGAKKSRWEDLVKNIKKAHDNYQKINFQENRPPLFAYESKYGENKIRTGATAKSKFGTFMTDILLPLSIEYNFMSRDKEKEYLANTYCQALLSGQRREKNEAIKKIAGGNSFMRTTFGGMVDATKIRPGDPLNCNKTNGRIESMENLIDELNTFRFQRIKTLLEFIKDQGWAEGSGIGSLSFQMNRCGAGFMHSMFLLRAKLREDGDLLQELVGSMKWYNDFNEIYQDDNKYIYDGTTADRIRTIFFYRLMIILIDNRNPDQQITDLEYYRTWVKHAFAVNKGLGGVIKPDYTGFHHKTFYGSAYVIQALTNGALAQYLLGGTSFSLDPVTKDNIRKTLETMRIVANVYSIPNGINGRFPGYTKGTLKKAVPAYAYSSYVHAHGTIGEGVDRPEMFLRLFDAGQIDSYLKEGKIKSAIHYWNTIGSLDVLRKASTLTCTSSPQPCVAENPPSGHWSKNFAALSIHRRNEWSVAVKGMSRYTWDYEDSGTENVFGVFASHGSLQISNNESALRAYDVDNGWDWTRVPGATTIKLDVDHVRTSKARNYNYRGKFAGGVSLIGSVGGDAQNGAFGMAFKKPEYRMEGNLKDTPLDKAIFEFKKSYFFYDHLIICVGSNIKLEGVNQSTNYAQTTIFQDKLLDKKKSTIKVGNNRFNLDAGLTLSNVINPMLEDTNGNVYKVENGDNIVTIEIVANQTSKNSNGKEITKGDYAVAYYKHKGSSSKRYSYKYAVLVAGGDRSLLDNYKVIKQSSMVHAIEISSPPGLSSQTKVYGYTAYRDFTTSPLTEGPVKSANSRSVIMAEKSDTTLYLAISDPSVKLGMDENMSKKKTCTVPDRTEYGEPFDPKNSDDVGSKLMFCVEGKSRKVVVTLNLNIEKINSVTVNGRFAGNSSNEVKLDNTTNPLESTLTFNNLVNGFSTEVSLAISTQIAT